MKKYEALCVFNPKTKEEKIDEIVSKTEKKIKELGGNVDKVDKWGTKRLAFRFRKYKGVNDGFYVIIYFNGEGDLPNKINAHIRIIEEIMRFAVVLSKGEAAEKVEVDLPGAEKEEKVESPQA